MQRFRSRTKAPAISDRGSNLSIAVCIAHHRNSSCNDFEAEQKPRPFLTGGPIFQSPYASLTTAILHAMISKQKAATFRMTALKGGHGSFLVESEEFGTLICSVGDYPLPIFN
jgi:hypothetical protein